MELIFGTHNENKIEEINGLLPPDFLVKSLKELKFETEIDETGSTLEENSLIVTLEAGSIMSWQKYIKNKGINFGIDKFGESAPYKDVYNHLDLSLIHI